MKKGLLFLFFIFLLGGGLWLVWSRVWPKKQTAGLQVFSEPESTIFLDGVHLGQTPFKETNLQPGEFTLKLVPQSEELFPWQEKIELFSSTLTVVRHRFAKERILASGQILTLEPLRNKNLVVLAVISDPDKSLVKIDGVTKGLTPLSLEDIQAGEHTIIVSKAGYEEEKVTAKVPRGQKLIFNVKLAEALKAKKEATPSGKTAPTPTPTPEKELAKPYVEIKQTETGWLNVRSEPSTAKGQETILTQIDPGEKYKFLEATASGWYKIEYEKGKEGWISGRYATLFR